MQSTEGMQRSERLAQELIFQLFEANDLQTALDAGQFGDHDADSICSILETARQLADDRFEPLASLMDENEPHMVDGEAVLPDGVNEALTDFREAGFFAAPFPAEYGGLELPYMAHSAANALFTAANTGLAGYPFLTIAAANMELTVASADQKRRYMAPMIEGRFFGTMCLSEPHAGSSLADIRTKAEPVGDGAYRISGSKMWISGGEHTLSENIVHHVLAKIPGGPPGVKGISLFIVPKYRVNADGSLGPRNGVGLAGLNHKMGYRGTTNCALSFGDDGECIGELLGEEHRGLATMFFMMNEARVGVALGAATLAYAGYAASLDYARERTQGRPANGRDPSTPMIPIIQHADVRRMLLRQKAYAEGGLSLCLYCASLIDAQHTDGQSEEEREQLHLLLEVLTPIAKAWCSETGLQANHDAIQVLGGYGYTRDFPVERFYRDNRLNPIHEGANGIQAIDLLGRKTMMQGGAALLALAQEIHNTAAEASDSTNCAAFAPELIAAVDRVSHVVGALAPKLAAGQADETLANATPFMEMVGRTVFAWIWLRQALAAERAAVAGRVPNDVAKGKLQACRYWFAWELPPTTLLSETLISNDGAWRDMAENWF